MHDLLIVKIALIGLLGIGAQWIAWRTQRPAIALMLVAGILAGPVTGLIEPERDFGTLLQPMIKLAVAVILFEGGLSLNFRDLRHAGSGVLRLVLIGGPLTWVLATAAAYYGAGLSLPVAALFGGILVVTGPTVIGPLLRNLSVGRRVRDILKWEGIVNDPIGALLAVAIYAYITYEGPQVDVTRIAFDVLAASFVAGLIGAALGYALTWLFPRGYVPEYLKAPLLLVTVIAGFVAADVIMHETGLITVTVMGVVMANRPGYAARALHRFKEDLAVLLISGVFVILSATLDWETIQGFQLRFVLFLALLLFVVRPLSVLPALLFSDVPWRERLFIAWIAPRGIVAVAITGLFALRLEDVGAPGAEALVTLSFGVVVATIFAHGFSARWLAARLGIESGGKGGILLVGANSWTVELAAFLAENGIKATIADTGRFALRAARRRDIPVWHGDLLGEAQHDTFELGDYQHMIVATDNDSYNMLVTSDLGPEMGHGTITRVAAAEGSAENAERGRVLFSRALPYAELVDRARAGWTFSRTRLTEQFGWEAFRANLAEDEAPLALIKPGGQLQFFALRHRPVAEAGDQVISFVRPPTPDEARERRTGRERESNGDGEAKPEPA